MSEWFLCARLVPHPGHRDGVHGWACPGRPDPDSVDGRAWAVIEEAVLDGLHGDASGLDDGVAVAVRGLRAAGLLVVS